MTNLLEIVISDLRKKGHDVNDISPRKKFILGECSYSDVRKVLQDKSALKVKVRNIELNWDRRSERVVESGKVSNLADGRNNRDVSAEISSTIVAGKMYRDICLTSDKIFLTLGQELRRSKSYLYSSTLFITTDVVPVFGYIKNGKSYNMNNELMVVHNAILYRLNPVTASGDRSGSSIFEKVGVIKDGNTQIDDNRFSMFDRGLNGALSLFIESIKDVKSEEEKIAKIRKFATYAGNSNTESKDCGVVQSWIRYDGKFENNTREGFLSSKFYKLYNEVLRLLHEGKNIDAVVEAMRIAENDDYLTSTQDGQLYINTVKFSIMFFERTGILIDPRILLGQMCQVRPATIKSSGVFVDPETYKAIVTGAYKLAEARGVDVWQHGDKSVKIEDTLFIADMNSVKLKFRYDDVLNFEMLAMGKESCSQGSKQLHKVALEYARQQGIKDKVVSLVDELEQLSSLGKYEKIMDFSRRPEKANVMDVLKAVKSKHTMDILAKSSPNTIATNKDMFAKSAKQAIDAMVQEIDRMQGELSLKSYRLISDPTFIITGGKCSGALSIDQAYCPNIESDKIIMFKYPVAEDTECKRFELVDMVSTSSPDITREEAIAIRRFFRNTKDALIVPSFEYIMKACAGLDFDYDGAVVMFKTQAQTRQEQISNYLFDVIYRGTESCTIIVNNKLNEEII